jgi:glycosyltransferase involved in cell wall biosynthesis
MRILIVSNLYPPDVIGGYELGCQLIAEALNRRGHEVTVAASEVRNPEHANRDASTSPDRAVDVRRIFLPQWEFELRSPLEPKVSSVALRLQRQILCDLPAALALRRLMEAQKFDVVYAFNLFGLGLLGILEMLLTSGVPVVVHLMDDFDAFIANNLKSGGLMARFGMLKKHLTAIVCSEGTRKRNNRLGPYGSEHLIYSGFPTVANQGSSKLATDDGSHVFKIVYSGQVTERKGVKQLVAAFRRLVSGQSERKLELHIIGAYAKGFDQELMRLDGDGGGSGTIVFHGYKGRAELLRMISGMDLGVYPLPPEEAFGYAPMECLACGVPVVITEGSGFGEMLPKDYPFTIRNRDSIDELADTMKQGMTDRKAADYALECFEFVIAKHDFESYGVTAIERVLSDARCSVTAWDFQELLHRYRVFQDYALAYPERVFNL